MTEALQVRAEIESWPIRGTFQINGYSWDRVETVHVSLDRDGLAGHGEASPVYYRGETANGLVAQIEAIAGELPYGVTREDLRRIMPPGAARNAVDAALWDLEAKRSGRRAWEIAGVAPRRIVTAYTIGLGDDPEGSAKRARQAAAWPVLKIKLDADRPLERVSAIRAARPDATLIVDANQAWTAAELAAFAPHLAALGVELVEQPLPAGEDEALEGRTFALPLCADESFQSLADLADVARRYQLVNIKLDKAGGLTEALRIIDAAREAGLGVFVGTMVATSLSIAPALIAAWRGDYADLDGPLLLAVDRRPGLHFDGAAISAPDRSFWG